MERYMSVYEEVSSRNKAKLDGKDNVYRFESYDPEWRTLDKVAAEDIDWFWEEFIPNFNSSIFAGNGGIGKSLVLLSIIAHVTNGKSFFCCGSTIQLPCGSVILMSAEGRDETDVVPKLIAANANMSLIHSITSNIGQLSKKRRLLELDKELSIIESKVKLLKDTDSPVRLIVIDPISYFTGEVKDHVPRDVANFVHQINDLAKEYSLTILFNKHRRKQSGGHTFSSLADEVGGTAAWVNSPRQAVGFIKHPKTPNVFLMGSIKSNNSKEKNTCYSYTIESTTIEYNKKTIKTVKLVWGDKMESINLNQASSGELYEKTKTAQCSDLIFNHIKENGVTTRSTIIEVCKKNDIHDRLRQRVINTMIKAGEIKKSVGVSQLKYELGDDFDGFGTKK